MFLKASKQAGPPRVQAATTAAPKGGLNARDPYSWMQETFALNLTNFVVKPQGLAVREGYTEWATGLPGEVETLMPYSGLGAGTDRLFAASDAGFYDVTLPGAVGAAVQSSLTSAQWQHVNFTGGIGNYLVCCNGVDAVRHYNSTTGWTVWDEVLITPSAPGEIKGIDPTMLKNVCVHQSRLWFVQPGTTSAWYLPVNSVGGEAEEFRFNFPRGGTLSQLASWSTNNGAGMSNVLAAISSEGDVQIWEGLDPDDATSFHRTATWTLGAPVPDCMPQQFGGDTLMLTLDGLMPLSKYMQSETTSVALTDTIQNAISSETEAKFDLSGWQIHLVPHRNCLILNVPQINPDNNIQFVMNTDTGGWSLFTGWPARCFATLNRQTYFGADTKVFLAFRGYKDSAANDGTAGDTYTATAQQAFTYFDDRSTKKRFINARINLLTSAGSARVLLDCNTDFNITPPVGVGSATGTSSSVWDSGVWNVDVWSGGLTNYNSWQTIGGVGYCASIVIALAVQSETYWMSTDWMFEVGAPGPG